MGEESRVRIIMKTDTIMYAKCIVCQKKKLDTFKHNISILIIEKLVFCHIDLRMIVKRT